MIHSIDALLESTRAGVLLPESACLLLCAKLTEILVNEPNIQTVHAPVAIVGDVHGQLHDVFELFRVGGSIPDTNYLFLGDYVDRGAYSVQTITLLACLKVRWPNRINLLRGNHESRQITQVYGFYSECCSRYGDQSGPRIWAAFTDMFDFLPVAALIDQQIFCTHGGLSPSIPTLDHIRVLQRFQEIPHEGPLADLMWSDPDHRSTGFSISSRGAGYLFGEQIFNEFCRMNGLSDIVRAHQLCMDGYQTFFNDRLSTVWSAPNYCFRAGNRASILQIDCAHNKEFLVFDACPNDHRQMASINADLVQSNPDYFL